MKNFVLEMPSGEILIVKASRVSSDWGPYVKTTVDDKLADKALRIVSYIDGMGIEAFRAEIDEVKEAARLKAIADEEQEKLAQETVRAKRITRIQNSKQNLNRMTLPQLRELVSNILDHLGL